MKITKRQLRRIIKEEKQKLNESFPPQRMEEYEHTKKSSLNDLMSSINSQIIFIEGQLGSGQYDIEDIFDYDFGHMAGLADLIDAAREKAAEEGVPFAEPNLSRIEQYDHRGRPATVSRWSMNESTQGNKMKITKGQLRRIIREQVAIVNDETIEDSVMGVLSDEGGAAGLDPLEAALDDLEGEDISLPDEPIEDLVSSVPGVERHRDGDFVDTTKLEAVQRLSKRQLRRIIREESKGSTKKYDDDSALQGDQDELPDALQKGIIDKTVTDRKEKNESFRITAQQLRRIIREAYEMSHAEVESRLSAKASEYHQDRALAQAGPGAIRELLLDDLLDNVPGTWDPQDFKDLIDRLSRGEMA